MAIHLPAQAGPCHLATSWLGVVLWEVIFTFLLFFFGLLVIISDF